MIISVFILILSVYLLLIYITEALTLNKIQKNKIGLAGANLVVSSLFLIFIDTADEAANNLFVIYGICHLMFFLYISYKRQMQSIKNNKYYKLIIKSIKETKWNVFYVVNAANKIIDISESFLDEIGLSKTEVIGKNLFKVFDAKISFISSNNESINNEGLNAKYKEYKKNVSEDDITINVSKFYNSSDDLVIIKFTETPIFISGDYRGRMIIGEKRTDNAILDTEQELLELKTEGESIRNKYIATLELMEEGLYYRSRVDNYIWLTDNMKELIKVDKNTMTIDDFELFIHREDYEEYKQHMYKLSIENPVYVIKYRIKSGYEHIWILEKGKLIIDGKKEQIIAVVNKVSELENSGLEMPSIHDLRAEMGHLINNKTPFALVRINLGNIQDINKAHSYRVGSVMMKEYITRLRKNFVTKESYIYKIEGLEFILLIENKEKFDTLDRGLSSGKPLLDLPIAIGGISEIIKPFVAVVLYPSDNKKLDDLISNSKEAIDLAIQNNVYVYFKDLKNYKD